MLKANNAGRRMQSMSISLEKEINDGYIGTTTMKVGAKLPIILTSIQILRMATRS